MSGTKKKILIVDDEENIIWSMEKYLSKDGYFIATANSAKKGAELINTSPFDLVITDMKMPEVDGFQFLSWIKKNHPDTKVVIMTAFGSPSVRDASKDMGAFRYFEKPVDLKQLRKFINETLTEKGFTGNILDIDLFDFVQMIILSRKQKLISVNDPISMQMGLLYLKNGDVVHAECSGLQGDEAFHTIMAMKSGMFSDMPWIDPLERTITTPFQFLLMESARIQDESQANLSDLEATVEAVRKVMEKQSNQHVDENSGIIKSTLEQLKTDMPELVAAIVIDGVGGRYVEGVSQKDTYNLVEAAPIFKQCFGTAGDAEVMLTSVAEKRKTMDELLITNVDDSTIMKKLKEGKYIFSLVFPKDVNIGLVRVNMKKYAELLESHLK